METEECNVIIKTDSKKLYEHSKIEIDKNITMESGHRLLQKVPVHLTRSDTMSIGSVGSSCSASSLGGASEGMDTEDSERDAKDGFGSSGRGSFSSLECRQKQSNLEHVQSQNIYENVSRPKISNQTFTPTGDLTSPVIENKLSDDLDGYFVMRTRLMSQSATILENGAAFGDKKSPGLCDNEENVKNESKTHSPSPKGVELFTKIGDMNSKNFSRFDDSDSEHDKELLQREKRQTSPQMRLSNSPKSLKLSSRTDNGEKMLVDEETEELYSNLWSRNCRRTKTKIKDSENCDKGSVRGKGRTEHVFVKSEPMSDDECQGLLTGQRDEDDEDSSASESIAEVEKFGLEAKLARVSKRRIYSRAKEMSKASDSSSESDSDSESEEEEEEQEKYEILEDIHEAKVLVNEAQPESEKLIKREALKMAVPDDLLSDYGSSGDSSASSTDSSSGESSESDSDSDLELSSVEESDDEDRKPSNQRRQNSQRSKDGLSEGLPKVEYLSIDLPESVQLKKLGCVSSIIGSLVIIQAEEATSALNIETVLFKSDRTVLGQVFEVFGPVISPFYSVRFNAPADIEQHGIQLKTEVWFAPEEANVTQYVFTEQLRKLRGSDASWKNDEEAPEEFLEFSDDEQEYAAKNKNKDRRRKVPQRRTDHDNGNQNEVGSRGHPPLQRQPAGRHHRNQRTWQHRHGNQQSHQYGNHNSSHDDNQSREWHRCNQSQHGGSQYQNNGNWSRQRVTNFQQSGNQTRHHGNQNQSHGSQPHHHGNNSWGRPPPPEQSPSFDPFRRLSRPMTYHSPQFSPMSPGTPGPWSPLQSPVSPRSSSLPRQSPFGLRSPHTPLGSRLSNPPMFQNPQAVDFPPPPLPPTPDTPQTPQNMSTPQTPMTPHTLNFSASQTPLLSPTSPDTPLQGGSLAEAMQRQLYQQFAQQSVSLQQGVVQDSYQNGYQIGSSWQRKSASLDRGTFSARHTGFVHPWQQNPPPPPSGGLSSPFRGQTSSGGQPPPPGISHPPPPPPPPSSASSHTSTSSQIGSINSAIFRPPPPPPEKPSTLPLIHKNAPATPDTPNAPLPAFPKSSVAMGTPSPQQVTSPWHSFSSTYNQMSPSFPPPPIPPPSFHPRMMNSFREKPVKKGNQN